MAGSAGMRRWLVVAGILVLLAAAGVARLFVHPPTDPADGAAAVVVLAGDARSRLTVATRLAESGAGVLAVSVDEGRDNEPARALCEDPGDLEVHCFTATRSDTRSEARALGALVDEQGWASIAVVTSSYHVVRAGMLIRRCTDAEVAMVEARAGMTPRRWVMAVLHETGGVLAAAAGGGTC
ncbi:YdcF family protein [Blastococcus sp. SYSU DS0539]